jgi:DNA-binding transcriptional LysR family regulator
MNLTDLEAFVAVVDHGSVVAAATRLHLTQSAVTRRIQNLEEVLGVPLLDRQTRPVQPTKAGKETYEFAKPVLSSVNDLKAAVVYKGETYGEFRFGVTRGIGELALKRPIECLRAAFPNVKIQAFAQWSPVLLERLQNRALDAAVIFLPDGSMAPAGLLGECLGTQTFSIVAAKALRLPRTTTLAQLSSCSWIINPAGCLCARTIEAAMLQQRLPMTVAVEAEGYDLQLSLVSQGVGLGVVMPKVLESSPFRKQLQVLKVKDVSPQFGIWVLHAPHIGSMAPAVQCLRDAIQQHLHDRKPSFR